MFSQTSPRGEESSRYLAAPEIHEQWESDYLNEYIEPLYEAIFDRLVASLGARPGATILDAGCGYGVHAMRLARRGLRVTGVDFSESALRAAEQHVERSGMSDRISLQRADLLGLPFVDASFDFINCWGVLMHVPDLDLALSELARVLRPGGRLALCENDMESLHVRFWEPALRLLKRGLGRTLPERRKTVRGIEEWYAEQNGGLLVRKTDMNWLQKYCAEQGLDMVERFPSQFTELYANLSSQMLKRAVYAYNKAWFDLIRPGGLSMGNVIIFEKRDTTSAAES
jgi:ubiquinone/menaquinone biosynthesis C-methylase UbiE